MHSEFFSSGLCWCCCKLRNINTAIQKQTSTVAVGPVSLGHCGGGVALPLLQAVIQRWFLLQEVLAVLSSNPVHSQCEVQSRSTMTERTKEGRWFLHPATVSLCAASNVSRKAFVALYATAGLDLVVWGISFVWLTKFVRGIILRNGLPLDYKNAIHPNEARYIDHNGDKQSKYDKFKESTLYKMQIKNSCWKRILHWLANTSWINQTRSPSHKTLYIVGAGKGCI